MNQYDVIIVGGGAAGLMAAISCAQSNPSFRIALLEKMEKCGRKIRITGKGRCNLTNNKPYEEFLDKVRCERDFFESSFSQFDNFKTADFFEKSGLRLDVLQGGRVYPRSQDAWDVVKCLEYLCDKNDVEVFVDCEVKSIDKTDSGFALKTTNGDVTCTKVIIATGGKSYPRTGSTGDGYNFAKKLGHSVTDLFPSLVPFEVKIDNLTQLRGLVVKNITISLSIDGEIVSTEMGEVEFFGFGVGGGAIYRLSRQCVEALRENKDVQLVFDFKPGLNENKLLGRMEREIETDAKLNVEGFVRKLFPQKMVSLICSKIVDNKNVLLSSLNIDARKKLILVIKSFSVQVLRDRGFAEAVITAGGVNCGDIAPSSLKSNICDGLSFAGEVLNIDADTGGYNLQVAFSTGWVAGKKI